VKAPNPPPLDERRAAEFSAELRERAGAWIPSWGLTDGEGDFGRALLEVAARFSAEVAERLDRAGEKMQRGFLDWLGVRGQAARPARMPVVFKLAEKAQAVLAQAPVRLQADAGGASVVFETEKDVRVVPGSLKVVVGADADGDAFYLPGPGLSDLEPLEPLPTQWQLKSFASVGATKLQLDPETGLAEEMIVETGGLEYRIVKADKGIVTIEPGLTQELPVGATLRKVTSFAPFDGAARNRQEHILYLGHTDLLNIEAAATLEIVGATGLSEGVKWEYWGKIDPEDEVDWQPLTLAPPAEQQPDALVLKKPKGAVEVREVGQGNSSRWIRAFRKTVTGNPFRVDEFGIRVNASLCPGYPPCPPPEETLSPAAEGMANTTPLVLDSVFFPLGKEPRQFDAFYLGSGEAFSKKGANVQLCFEMSDPSFSTLAAVREGPFANRVLAGVAKDRALHLLSIDPTSGSIGKFQGREPLQPPAPGFLGQAELVPSVTLDQPPAWRLPVWSEPDLGLFGVLGAGFLVSVTAGDAVWVWREVAIAPALSGWIPFGSIPATPTPAVTGVSGLVFLDDPNAPQMVALRNYQMAVRQWRPEGPKWNAVPTEDGMGTTIRLEAIVPVLSVKAGVLVTSVANGMVGVSSDNKLYTVDLIFDPLHHPLAGLCTQLTPTSVDIDVRPVAVRLSTGGPLVVALAKTSLRELVTSHSDNGDVAVALEADARVLGIDAVLSTAGDLNFIASVQLGGGGYLASWMPHTAVGGTIRVYPAPVPPGTGQPGGAPAEIASRVVIPGTQADLLVADLDLSLRLPLQADVKPGIVAAASTPKLKVNDVVTLDSGPPFEKSLIEETEIQKGSEDFYPIDPPFTPGSSGALYGFYHPGDPLTGNLKRTAATLKLDPTDTKTVVGSLVLADDGEVYRVTNISSQLADVEPQPPADKTGAEYRIGVPISARLAPYMRPGPANNNWDAGLLDRASLIFPAYSPEVQRGKAFRTGLSNHPLLIVLSDEWTAAPPSGVGAKFILDAAVGSWSRLVSDTSSNPELSWEYGNGKGWWKLDVTLDGTLNFKRTGAVQFEVPADIAPTDWSGKTDYWIRARLIGGDYGREKVTVRTKNLAGGDTEQTVDRSSEGIRPPSVVKLYISYQLCDEVRPTFVLSMDSGSLRDQSEANRTAGATVEAFVPLAVTLGHLSSTLAPPQATPGCPPEEEGPSGTPPAPPDCLPEEDGSSGTPPGSASDAAPAGAVPPATGRALFIGLDGVLSGSPVNVLLLVEKEREHGTFAPITIEALVAERFVPIVGSDATRALGESGLLSLSFAIDPTPRELFGETLSWLRLAPGPRAPASDWKPTLRGAYLNAAWASATETLTRELVGSSEGAPNLTLNLARPPVLHDTLELRVKEPLGEEERDQLRKSKPDRVLTDVQDLPGDWVLWDRVIDPLDEPPGARVYALDESIGEIRFGNGQHGMIPPIGRDSIVAFSYQRTEPDPAGSDSVPGNAVAARDPLNLVSPVESVEAVIAADQAAGGAPPERAERVVRFGSARLRHRGRAVTARDLEDLALQSSPDIAQARSIPRGGYVRLVIVMRGKNPVPTGGQVRELQRLLLAAGPLSLSAPKALRIGGPRIRRLRIELELRVETLDDAGRLTDDVKRRLIELFDTATGGSDKDGWPLGASPSQDDVAFALLDAPRLAGIGGVKLVESLDHGLERPWPKTLGPTELVRLADDPIRIQFVTVMVIR
jgi:hypothetical protein